jgi:hypothetical protein
VWGTRNSEAPLRFRLLLPEMRLSKRQSQKGKKSGGWDLCLLRKVSATHVLALRFVRAE